MDGSRFDALSRSLFAGSSRRGLTRLLGGLTAGGSLSFLGLASAEAGRKKGKKGKKGKKDKKKKKRAPTCFDRVTNGSESDVDCGGTCPRCVDGKRCASGGDCQSGFCTGTCQRCSTTPNNCNADAAGPCFCRTTPSGNLCLRSPSLQDSCEACPAGTVHCEPVGLASGFQCFPLCGAG
jgi:hypothetical protein